MSYKTESGREGVSACDYSDSKEEVQQFILDADDCGLETFHYHGRYGYKGPAVIIESLGLFRTDVDTQHDNMGLNYVVYPVEKADLLEK